MDEASKSLDDAFIKPINIAELDVDFKRKVAEMLEGKTYLYCFQCSTCTAVCPVAAAADVKPHQIMRMTALGMKNRVLISKMIWLCTTCFMCTERCPQGVKVCEVMFNLKNIASRDVGFSSNLKLVGQNIYKFGTIYKIEPDSFDREDLHLPSIPKVDVEDYRKIMKKTQFDKLVEVRGE